MKKVDETVCVKIKPGFGSHTVYEPNPDPETAEDQPMIAVIHRSTDLEGFFLPLSAYKEFTDKYILCDPNTRQPLAQEIITVESQMATKLKAATATATAMTGKK